MKRVGEVSTSSLLDRETVPVYLQMGEARWTYKEGRNEGEG